MRAITLCGFIGVIFAGIGCFAQTSSSIANPPQTFDLAEPAMLGPGLYSAPFIPLISTPIMNLSEPRLQVGASNSTGDNVVGAQNSTTLPQQVSPRLIAPRLAGATVSYDLYPRANSGESQ